MLLFWFLSYLVCIVTIFSPPWLVVRKWSVAGSLSVRDTIVKSVLLLLSVSCLSFLPSLLQLHARGDLGVSLLHAFVLSSTSTVIILIFRQIPFTAQRHWFWLLTSTEFILIPLSTLPLLVLYEPSSVSFMRIYFFYGLSTLGLHFIGDRYLFRCNY
jgi:hypothetical protein